MPQHDDRNDDRIEVTSQCSHGGRSDGGTLLVDFNPKMLRFRGVPIHRTTLTRLATTACPTAASKTAAKERLSADLIDLVGEPVPYAPMLALQTSAREALWEEPVAELRRGKVFLLEHRPVYTCGIRAKVEDVGERVGPDADVIKVRRGGEVTYHGPGQITGYVVLDVRNHGGSTKCFMHGIEEVMIRAVNSLVPRVEPGRHEDHPGVWVGGSKVGAIGVSVSKWVSLHGFALNVEDLQPRFDAITPCGISEPGLGVGSLHGLADRVGSDPPGMESAKRALIESMQDVFNLDLQPLNPSLVLSHSDQGVRTVWGDL